jgi:hypothetical protein
MGHGDDRMLNDHGMREALKTSLGNRSPNHSYHQPYTRQ